VLNANRVCGFVDLCNKNIVNKMTILQRIRLMNHLIGKTELQRFLGMINYLGKFLPNLSKETAPLRQLLEKDVQWRFEQPHETAINTLKKMITSSPAYYEPKLPTRVTTDASKAGLGAVLEQNYDGEWKPIAFASRAMTQYHKPLKAIFSKPLNKAPPRIQRFMLRLQKYDLGVEFTPGSEIPVADTLSRAYLNHQVKPEVPEQEIRCHVHSIIKSLTVSMSKLDELKRETAKDENLQKLKLFIREGCPNDKKTVPDAVKPYLTHLDEISEAEGIMLRGSRIIVPTSMRREMKSRIHEGHLGIERCKARAREALYWPEGSTNSMAQVMKKADKPRSYILQDETGRLLRRNRRDLLRTDESFIGKGPQDLRDNKVEVMEPATSDTQSTAIAQEPTTCSSIPQPTTCSSIPSTCSSLPVADQKSPYKTRSGRNVRPPAWLQDYEH
ncbi:Hypothetical predicted protein, partial [Paramuricea clavata]